MMFLLLSCMMLAVFAPVATTLFWLATGALLLNTLLKIACLIATPRGKKPSQQFAHQKWSKPAPLPKISILVPLYKEAGIAASLIERLRALDYPAPLLEICLVTEADDHITRQALQRCTLPAGMQAINVPSGTLKTKPRAMNYALDFARGSVVGEDADLGIRLARHGYRCEMIQTVTHEEANNRLWPWVRQRSRWLKGYAMTWFSHMRRPLKLWRDLGPWKFMGFQILFLGTLLSFALAPVLWWNMGHVLSAGALPSVGGLAPEKMHILAALFIGCELVTLTLFAWAHSKLTRRPAILWIFTLPAYFMLATLAAYKGLIEVLWKPYYWDKTEHGVSKAEPALDL